MVACTEEMGLAGHFTAYLFVGFDFEIGDSILLKSFYFLYKSNTLIIENLKTWKITENKLPIYLTAQRATTDFLIYFSIISFYYIHLRNWNETYTNLFPCPLTRYTDIKFNGKTAHYMYIIIHTK